MEFKTDLSQNQIRQILSLKTKPFSNFELASEIGFLSKWNHDNTFYLWKSQGLFSVRPVLPFVGKVNVHNNITVIEGDFSNTKSNKAFLLLFIGFAWLIVLAGIISNPGFSSVVKTSAFAILVIWTFIGYAFFYYLPGILQKKQRKEVLNFIQENLVD